MKDAGFLDGSFVWPGEIDRCGISWNLLLDAESWGRGAATPEVHDIGKHDIGKGI